MNIAPDQLEEACKPIWEEAIQHPDFKELSDNMTYEEFKDEVRVEVESLIEIGAIKAK